MMKKGGKTIAAVFPGGPKEGNPARPTSTIKARRKGDPQHYVDEKSHLFVVFKKRAPSVPKKYCRHWGKRSND